MKCPKCATNHKKKDGMQCKCGYLFVLDPKQPPKLTDKAVAATIDKLSGSGRYYFTFNQLYAALHRVLEKKAGKERITGAVFIPIIAGVIAVVVGMRLGWWVSLIPISLGAVGALLLWKRQPTVPHQQLSEAIRRYKDANPIPFLVEGNRFSGSLPKDQIKEELFSYAPERILIVPTKDMVDMLVLNRFHFENKAAVVSGSKYPEHVFKACQRFLEKNPDLPVEVIHDVSGSGARFKDKLLADPTWHLEGKNVKDLGLFPADVAKIKNPIWIPSGRPASAFAQKSADPVQAKMDQGMAMPLDFAGPTVMMGALALAVVGGLLLMSEELLAEQARRGVMDAGTGGGFG